MTKHIPQVRFVGFEDEWEDKKLEEVFSKIGDGIHGTPKYSDEGEYAFINGNNLVNGNITLTPETKFVTKEQLTTAELDLTNDTFLMSINGTIGNLAWYRGENIMLGKSAAYFVPSTINNKFAYSIMQTSKIRNHFLNNLTGTTIKNLGLKTIKDTPFTLPSLPEQTQIGSFFRKLDNLLTLHQHKIDTLKQQKQTYLKLMFPAKGQKVPALRFQGFEEEWEEKKLGEVGKIERESVNPKDFPEKYFDEYSMPAFDLGKTPNRVVGTDMLSSRLKIKGNSLLINKLNVRQRRIWLVKNPSRQSVSSPEFLPFVSKTVSLEYLKAYFLADSTTRYLEDISTGTSNSQKLVSPNDIKNFKLPLPPRTRSHRRFLPKTR